MNLEIQGLTNIDEIDGEIASSEDYDAKIELVWAKRLPSAITITDANYGEARTMLQERYENRRAIVREHISSIVTASTATKEAGSFRNLMQTADEHRRALEALGLNMDEMDIYTVYHAVEKMDAESRREWELEHPGTDLLKYEDLHKFLITRCRALEAAHGSKQSTNRGIEFGQTQSDGKRNHSLSVTQTNNCPQCKQAHGLFACDEFKKKTVDNRRKFVRDEGLCFNCLRSGHTAKDCSSMKKCKLCNKSQHDVAYESKQCCRISGQR